MRYAQGVIIGLLCWLAVPLPAAAQPTLEAVRARGSLRCGVVELGAGLAGQADNGRWMGFYPDFCRALAAAAIGNADNVVIVNVSLSNRFDALLKGGVDALMTGSTWTFGRDVDMRIAFPALYLFDGQSFMAHVSENIRGIADLKGKSVCVPKGTTTLPQVEELNKARNLNMTIQPYETIQGSYSSFFSRQCQAMVDDATGLSSNRALSVTDPAQYVILAERTSKEPLAPAVRKDDPAWEDVVRWVVYATIAAEELGISSTNVDSMLASPDPAVRRFLGLEPGLGKGLGLDPRWAYRIVKAVGNYGEIFDRSLGAKSSLKLDRGLNKPWTQGGLLWAPPFR